MVERNYHGDLIGAGIASAICAVIGFTLMGFEGAALAGSCVFFTQMISKNL